MGDPTLPGYHSLKQDESAEEAEWAALGNETVRNCWTKSDK